MSTTPLERTPRSARKDPPSPVTALAVPAMFALLVIIIELARAST